MKSLFHIPRPARQDQAEQIHLFWTVLGLLALSFTIESLVEIFILPANLTRWLFVIGVIDGGGLALFFLARAGQVRQAGVALICLLWALVTVLAITDNGVRSPTVDIAYLVIILVAGLVLGERAGILTGILCCVTLLGMAVAGIRGFLPAGVVNRSILATLEADVFYLAMVMVIQYLAIQSIRQAFSRAHHELLERQRVEASLKSVIEDRAQNQMRLELNRLMTERLENERLKIARDLHDGPVQELVGLIFSLENRIAEEGDEASRLYLKSIQVALQEQVAGLRGVAGELRSASMAQLGLEEAIRAHLNSFQEKHPEINVRLDAASQNGRPIPPETKLTLFRIYQEALQKVVRHSRASLVEVRLSAQGGQVRLDIQDNGVGFDPPSEWLELAHQGHLGLVGMRERAETIGGRLEMASRAGQGTTVRVWVPLTAKS